MNTEGVGKGRGHWREEGMDLEASKKGDKTIEWKKLGVVKGEELGVQCGTSKL